MENGTKDFTSVGRYLDLLNDAIKQRNEKPNRLNIERCNKYYKLFCDEHIKVFGFKPDTSVIKDFENYENFNNNSNNNKML